MKKIEAVTALVSGEADSIKHRTSTFILFEDSVVNARSKKALDMSNAHEEDWEMIVVPKWYEDIPETGYLCWLGPDYTDMALIGSYDDKGFHGINGDSWDNVALVKQSELSNLVFDWETKTKVTKKKAASKKHDINDTPTEKDMPTEEKAEKIVDDGVIIAEVVEVGKSDTLPTQNTEPTVKKKDVIIDPGEEEIPF